jgi:hypothetical protein
MIPVDIQINSIEILISSPLVISLPLVVFHKKLFRLFFTIILLLNPNVSDFKINQTSIEVTKNERKGRKKNK